MITKTTPGPARGSTGVWHAVAAYSIWGLTPLYWNLAAGVPAVEILLHRVVWGAVFAWIVVVAGRNVGPTLRMLRGRTWLLFGAALLNGANWGLYIWSVTSGRVLEASLGYYINPLVSVFLGTVVLRERLKGLQIAALAGAALGVVYLTLQVGSFPWVSVTLALSFGTYGLIKKHVNLPGFSSLCLELSLILPIAVVLLVILQLRSPSAFLAGPPLRSLVLAGAGIVTVIPLVLFTIATTRLPLSTVGMLQYIAPTLMFVIGVAVFGEYFDMARLPGFVAVWAALGLHSLHLWRLRAVALRAADRAGGGATAPR